MRNRQSEGRAGGPGISSQRICASAKNHLIFLQTEHEQALEEISNLRPKNKASASAQKAESK